MKRCFLVVGSVLATILLTSCDLDPVVWDGNHYMKLKHDDRDAGTIDAGQVEEQATDTQTEMEDD